MGSTRKGMLNVLIAAVLWGSSGVCAQYIMEQSQMSSQFLTMTRLIFAGLILLTLSFIHGDKIFSIINNHKDAISLLIFSVGWRANRTAHFFANHRKIERSHGNGAAIPLTDYYRRLVLTGA